MKRVVVLGSTGQVGRELTLAAWPAGLCCVPVDRTSVDLGGGPELAERVAALEPAVVVNAAAYTAVDRAESEPALAHRVNGEGPGHVALGAARAGAPIVHLSTDYVFDGSGARPWTEEDPVRPLSVYGRSKLEGEERVRALNPRHVVVRTAWVYSPWGQNFVKTMLRLGREREELRVVHDQRGTPTSAGDIARALVRIVTLLLEEDRAERRGLFHYTAAGEASWAELADATFEHAARRWPRRPRVVPIPASEWPSPVARPAYSVLDGTKVERVFGVVRPPWRQPLGAVVDAVLSNAP